ncbi:hypothetical protein C8J35_109178 [Rhizobium sp. PP-F2F-G38]|nr:hypothetical protein C8J35_109178 [Rhizobium sp. PP-F2F-G38]
MSLSLAARMEMMGPLTEEHVECVRPTVAAWAERAVNVTRFHDRFLSAGISPITAFVASEMKWRTPA